MSWTVPSDFATGHNVTAAEWNSVAGTAGNLAFLGTHQHTGAAGDGSGTVSPAEAIFTDASAPAAPGAGKTALYAVSGTLHYRAGAAGSDIALVDVSGTQTLTNKTLTTPTIASFTNATHDHTNVAGGGALTGVPLVTLKGSDESVTSSTTLQDDDDFSFAIGANEVWLVELTLLYVEAATPGGQFKAGWSLPSGASGYHEVSWPSGGNMKAAQAAATTANNFGEDTASVELAFERAIIVNGATGGTAQWQWAQQSSSGNASTIKQNSVMRRTKLN